MKDQDKFAGRGQTYNPEQERDVKVKGAKTRRDLPDEALGKGSVLESQSAEAAENTNRNIDRGGDVEWPVGSQSGQASHEEQKRPFNQPENQQTTKPQVHSKQQPSGGAQGSDKTTQRGGNKDQR